MRQVFLRVPVTEVRRRSSPHPKQPASTKTGRTGLDRIAVRRVLTTACAAVAVSGCELGQGPRVPTGLVGTWSWVEATGGIAGQTTTPESTGSEMTLVLSPSGTARLLRSGVSPQVASYGVVQMDGAGGPVWEIRFDPPLFAFEMQTARLPRQDELVLVDPCCDGFMWRFERSR